MVLAFAFQTFKERGGGGALVGFKPCATPHVEKGIWLFWSGGNNAARTVIFKAACHHHLVICEQGRGQRVTRKAPQTFAVEYKILCGGAVQETATRGQARAHLGALSSGRLAEISCKMRAGGALVCAG